MAGISGSAGPGGRSASASGPAVTGTTTTTGTTGTTVTGVRTVTGRVTIITNLYADARQRARIADTYDKPPREFNSRRGKDKYVSRAYAKKGLDRNGSAFAKKTAYANSQPLGKGELSKKARSSRYGLLSKADKAAYSKRKAQSSRTAMPKGQLSRKELAFKASSGEQRFKASQDSVKASKGTGAKERTIRTPIAKLSRKDIADYSGSGGTAKTKLASRSKPQPIAPASKRSAPSAPGKVVQSPAGASYAKQVQNTVKRSKSKRGCWVVNTP